MPLPLSLDLEYPRHPPLSWDGRYHVVENDSRLTRVILHLEGQLLSPLDGRVLHGENLLFLALKKANEVV